MNGSLLMLVVVIATALAFDFTNGFHDTANAMATSIATGALKPRVAVALSGALNAVGAFVSIKVATTIAKGIVDSAHTSLNVVFAALVGALAWNLVTWYFSLPSSSSHALIGGLIGAAIAADGTGAVQWAGVVKKVLVPALVSPILAGVIALVGTFVAYRLINTLRREEDSAVGFRWGQIGSASLVSLAHGTNDAQKTMGVITLALIAHGSISRDASVPTWVIIAAAATIGAGTYIGGWRVIRTLGHRVTKIEPPQGFAAEITGATVLLASSFHGYPLSTTHIVSGSVMGSGVGRRLAGVRWGVAGQMAFAWALTLPVTAGAAFVIGRFVDGGTIQAAIVTVAAVVGAVGLFIVARRDPVNADNVNLEAA